MSRELQGLFRRARRDRRPLFLPYVCVGYPTYRGSLEAARAALRAGASGLELGIPFSDPIADGPTLQAATHRALVGGTRTKDVFHLIRDLRRGGSTQPLLVMTYLNLIERMGAGKFAARLRKAGGNGIIVPDLPVERSGPLKRILKGKGLALIPFLAPTSGPKRVKMADSQRAPFLYYVSLTGVTGARRDLATGLLASLRILRRRLRTPLVVGFGISTPAQAAQVGRVADGVIIASALVNLIARTPAGRIGKAVEGFCRKVVKNLQP